MTALLDRLSVGVAAVTSHRRSLLALSIVRIAIGTIILADLMIHVGGRQELWGVDSWYTVEHMERDATFPLSIFMLGDAAWVTDVAYVAYAALAMAFVLGWRTSLVTPLLWVTMWSFQERNPYLTNGGDNLVRIVLFYLMFAQLDAYLSVRRTPRRRVTVPGTPGATREIVRTVAHQAALAACVMQLSVLYVGSALYKVQGEMWQEGTAVYYITRVAEYNAWPELTGWLASSALLVTAATYSTVLIQLAFPFSLMRSWSRHLVLVLLIGMHLSIGILMGLPVFSAFMIAADLLLVTDDEWRSLHRRGARFVGRLGARRKRMPRESAAAALAPVSRSMPAEQAS